MRQSPQQKTCYFGNNCYFGAKRRYHRHLEEAARGVIAGHMNIEAVASSDMTEADRKAFANARPSASELENDRWED